MPDYKELEDINPPLIAEEVCERAELTYTLLSTLLRKNNDSEEELKKRIGVAMSVVLNLSSQQMSVYASKLGVVLIASGQFSYIISHD